VQGRAYCGKRGGQQTSEPAMRKIWDGGMKTLRAINFQANRAVRGLCVGDYACVNFAAILRRMLGRDQALIFLSAADWMTFGVTPRFAKLSRRGGLLIVPLVSEIKKER